MFFGTPTGLTAASDAPQKQNSDVRIVAEKENIFGAPIALLSEDSRTRASPEDVISTGDEVGSHLTDSLLPNFSLPPSTTQSRANAYGIKVSTFEGKAFTLKRKPKRSIQRASGRPPTDSQKIGNLLDVPIHRLLDTIKRENASQFQHQNWTATSSNQDHTLWVDRYRPQRFTELTGNERTAREALQWVKQWDFCVFGKRNVGKRTREVVDQPKDPYQRPREKLLLLSGPPGLGKTTLAHVVANHAGYDVMEINASDSRSGREVEERIKPALESGSTIGSTKPVLLILDEIDGATGSGDNSATFISKLLYLLQEKPRKKGRAGQQQDQGKRPILRPIVCICNDYNASSLAKLRPHAFHVRFIRPADIHIVKRLKEICDLETLKADAAALSALAGIARGDMRGCINTLQFIKSRNEPVSEHVVRKATLGMKENETSIVSTLNTLFAPLSKKRSKELGLSEQEQNQYIARLCKEIEGAGKDQFIANGCFAHYISRRQFDPHFTRFEQASDWLATFDLMSSHMYTDGDFAALAYLPYTLIPFYPLFQERGGGITERNSEDWENLQRTRANEEVYKSLAHCMRSACCTTNGDFRSFITTPNLQLEFAPYLNRIISPPLKPINQQVVKPKEQQILTRMVQLMSILELNFLQERSEDGHLAYRLDPPIDVFVTYDGKRGSDIVVSRYAFRHMVATELEAAMGGNRDTQKGQTKTTASSSADSFPPSKKARISPQQKDSMGEKVAVDFFGRPITTKDKPVGKGGKGKPISPSTPANPSFQVGYKFLEGNSAAVRKPIKIEAFL